MSKIVITIETKATGDPARDQATSVWLADWVSKLISSAHIEKYAADITINSGDNDVILHKGYDC